MTIGILDNIDKKACGFDRLSDGRYSIEFWDGRTETMTGDEARERGIMITSFDIPTLIKQVKNLESETDAENKLLQDINGALADELNKAEAQAAVMRQALAEVQFCDYAGANSPHYGYRGRYQCPLCSAEQGKEEHRKDCSIGKAFSETAGKELLERMRKLEAVVSAVKLVLTRKDGLEHYFTELDDALNALEGDVNGLR